MDFTVLICITKPEKPQNAEEHFGGFGVWALHVGLLFTLEGWL